MVVNTILTHARNANIPVRPLKLQKLLYFFHGFYLRDNQAQGLLKESFYAWPYGPVIPSVYYHFRDQRDKPIGLLSELGGKAYIYSEKKTDVYKVLNNPMSGYWEKSDMELSDLTHRKNGAWYKAYEQGLRAEIKKDDIIDEFGANQ